MEQEHSPVMRFFVEDDIGKAIVRQPVGFEMECNHVLDKKKTVFNLSLHFVPSLQSAICILYLVCILYPVCSLQSAFCTDRFWVSDTNFVSTTNVVHASANRKTFVSPTIFVSSFTRAFKPMINDTRFNIDLLSRNKCCVFCDCCSTNIEQCTRSVSCGVECWNMP